MRGVVVGCPRTPRGEAVSAQGPDFSASARTSAGGTEIAACRRGLTLRANAATSSRAGARHRPRSRSASGQAEATAEIRFEQGFRVDGHVHAAAAVPDAMVMVFPDGGNRRSASGRTDEAGGYASRASTEGHYTLIREPEAGADPQEWSSAATPAWNSKRRPRASPARSSRPSQAPDRRRRRPHRRRRGRHALRQHGLDRQLRPLRLRGHGAEALPRDVPEAGVPN